jgi:hypothetical protein
VNVTSIKVKEESHAKNWRIDFLPWSDANPAATAGQHNKGKRLVLVFDEGSEIADIIFETAEGALTDETPRLCGSCSATPRATKARSTMPCSGG